MIGKNPGSKKNQHVMKFGDSADVEDSDGRKSLRWAGMGMGKEFQELQNFLYCAFKVTKREGEKEKIRGGKGERGG